MARSASSARAAPDGSWDFRDQPAEFWDHYQTDFPADVHVRVHPLLAWTELDIWRYVERERIPVCELYFARGGKRYRSLGESDITFPIDSDAATIAGNHRASWSRRDRASAPAVRWITSAKTRSNGCARPDTCDGA